MILTRKELDAMGCATPDCGHDHGELYFNQRCHPSAWVAARYVKATGNLVLECSECERTVAEIAVSPWRPMEERGIEVS